MAWVQLVALLALFEYLGFGTAARACPVRIKAPAITGEEHSSATSRAAEHLELLIVFLPVLAIAAAYWNRSGSPQSVRCIWSDDWLFPRLCARAAQRGLGYGLSIVPVLLLVLGSVIGVVRALLGM